VLRKVKRCLVAPVAAFFFAVVSTGAMAGGTTASDQSHQKEAFESAKELGSTDAWNAFLNAYPSGFYADMARAYLKKLDGGGELSAPSASSSPQLAPSSARAAEKSCDARSELRSEHSREPTKITFVNKSGMYRGLMWIDFEGNLKDYGGVNAGEQVTLETFRTHPWMVVTGPGDCLQVFMPAAEPSIVELVRLAADDGPAKTSPAKQKAPEKKAETRKPLVCAKNYKLRNGECVLLQNCGKNAYRSAEGDCYCNKGYKMQNGKCVWPHDKQGFEVAPWKKTGCKSWQAQCSQGNGSACTKYEENCQVN
jgi:hypothetical protein